MPAPKSVAEYLEGVTYEESEKVLIAVALEVIF